MDSENITSVIGLMVAVACCAFIWGYSICDSHWKEAYSAGKIVITTNTIVNVEMRK